MENQKVIHRYAKTLFSYSREQGLLDAVVGDIEKIQSVFNATPRLEAAFSNPILSEQVLSDFMKAGLERGVSAPVKSFIRLLQKKRRLDILFRIPAAFLGLVEEHRGILRARLRAARPLGPESLENIRRRLELRFPGKSVLLVQEEVPALIAGFQVQIGDTIIDSSIQSSLKILKRTLAA